MAMQENRPNIVVDENFIMLEKRLRRRYAQRASAYSNADAIEQERNGARAFAIAPEAYGDSKFIGGISMYQSGRSGGTKYMTTDDFVALFNRCHDTFGAMNFETVAPAQKKVEDTPVVIVNRKKVEQIKKIQAKEAAKARKKNARAATAAKRPVQQPVQRTAARPTTARPATTATTQRATRPASENIRIESSMLDAFFTKLSAVKGRALASVAAFAICCTFAIGGIVALNSGANEKAAPMERVRASEAIEQVEDEVRTNLLSTLE